MLFARTVYPKQQRLKILATEVVISLRTLGLGGVLCLSSTLEALGISAFKDFGYLVSSEGVGHHGLAS